MNKTLSIKRAEVVARARRTIALMRGVSIEPVGYEIRPVATNATARGRAKNRRVAFRVIGGECKA